MAKGWIIRIYRGDKAYESTPEKENVYGALRDVHRHAGHDPRDCDRIVLIPAEVPLVREIGLPLVREVDEGATPGPAVETTAGAASGEGSAGESDCPSTE